MSSVAETHRMRCPKCKSDEAIRVSINVWADLYSDGSEATGDHEWDENSRACCSACNFGAAGKVATVFDFALDEDIDTESYWRCAICLRLKNVESPSTEINDWWVCGDCAKLECDVCLAGNPALGGNCGDKECICQS